MPFSWSWWKLPLELFMIKGDVFRLFLYGNLGRRKQTMRWLVYAIKSLIPASLALAGFCLPMLDGLQTSSSYKIHAPLAQSTNIVFVMPVEGMKNPGATGSWGRPCRFVTRCNPAFGYFRPIKWSRTNHRWPHFRSPQAGFDCMGDSKLVSTRPLRDDCC